MKRRTRIAIAVLLFTWGTALDAHCQSFVTNGLVAYFPFNGNAEDESGNGHDGVVIGATPATDRFGLADGAMYFNVVYWPNLNLSGSNVIIVPRIEMLDFNQEFTISLWVKPHQLFGPLTETLISCGQGNSNVYLRFGRSYGADGLGFGWGEYPRGVGVSLPGGSLDLGWWQVAVVRSAQDVSLYWNGSLLTNAVMDAVPDWEHMWLGRNQDGWSPLNGLMDDVRLYNRALTAAEMRQLYELEGPPFARADKLIHLYLSNLRVGTNYQLQVSSDLANWIDLGPPFTAISTTTNSFHEVANGLTFWRLKPPLELSNYESAPRSTLTKAVRLFLAHLSVGNRYQLQFSEDYQLQFSKDRSTWIDQGPVLTATEPTLVYPEYLDVPDWGSPVFRLKARP